MCGCRWRRWKNQRVPAVSWAWSRAQLCMGRLRLRPALTSSSGFSSGEYGGRKWSSIRPGRSASRLGPCGSGARSGRRDEMDFAVEVACGAVQEAAHDVGVEAPGEDREVHAALRADRGHRGHREPVATAAHDWGAALLAPGAAGDLVRADAGLVSEKHSPFAAFAVARIAGQVSSRQTRTVSAPCSAARLSGRWKDGPRRRRYLPTPCSVSRTRYSFGDQVPYAGPAHNWPARPRPHGR